MILLIEEDFVAQSVNKYLGFTAEHAEGAEMIEKDCVRTVNNLLSETLRSLRTQR